jgi:hypothetical protein
MKLRALAASVLLLTGCDKLPQVHIVIPDLPKIALEALPKVDGKSLLMQISTARLEVDPTVSDPITAVGSCADLITYCVSDGKALDDCVAATPACKTAEPWKESACCPAACQDGYTEARKTAEPLDAFEKVFFLEHTCFPGLAAALEGQS